MSWAVLLLVLSSYCSCSEAQFVVNQEATISVGLSTEVRLSCSRSVGSVAGDNYPQWVKQLPGEVPQLVVGSSGTSNQNHRPYWTPVRFTGSISGGLAVLTISTIQTTDEGDYYCVLWGGNNLSRVHMECSYCSRSAAQFVVTQEAAISGSIGNDARLTCGRSGGSVTGGNYPSWYYQTPGGVPKLVVYSTGSNHNNRPSWTSDRFTGSISGGLAVLSISRVQADDDGDYHCLLYDGGNTPYTVIQTDRKQSHNPSLQLSI
ncbi:immunoglobulin lambda-1 light chain-like [Pelobates cultripes]|nr:immunoglobulin lambda-1 light chain-like [Pelobates cultripes]